MLSRLRARLTYANVVSSICLFLVLSGGTAVALDGTDTVFTDDIVNGEVNNADVAANGITATRLAAGSVGTSEVAQSSLVNADIAGNTIASSRIANDTLTELDIADQSIGSGELDFDAVGDGHVQDGSLLAGDVFLHHATVGADLPPVGANSCVAHDLPIAGFDVQDFDRAIIHPPPAFPLTVVLTVPAVGPIDANDNEVELRLCNVSAADADPTPADYRVLITR